MAARVLTSGHPPETRTKSVNVWSLARAPETYFLVSISLFFSFLFLCFSVFLLACKIPQADIRGEKIFFIKDGSDWVA